MLALFVSSVLGRKSERETFITGFSKIMHGTTPKFPIRSAEYLFVLHFVDQIPLCLLC